MADKLVIVESPAKAKTINKILGKDYVVKSSMGHVRDLPVKSIGVDVNNDFTPKYVLVKGRKKIIDELKKTAKSCTEVYLAPDPDREGEAIAWHLKAILEKANKDAKFLRVQYNEVTPKAVKAAFCAPTELDMNRVDAQQARRILDRIVGYTVSPMLWRRIKRGLSAGRVQSVALRLVCEREAEIRKFVPEKYWIFGAKVRKLVAPVDPFPVKLTRIDDEKAEIKSEEHASKISSELKKSSLSVSDVSIKNITKKASPPYITSTLQQAGSSYCSYSPRRTMNIAQKLYEGIAVGGEQVGLITYMRTDSFSISADAINACREYVTKEFGKEYYPEKPNVYKGRKSAQEAHEAIRPTDVLRTPESISKFLEPAELKLYRLIWRRFVASQMTPAKIEQRTVKIVAASEADDTSKYTFQATASDVKFPGYMKVTGADHDEKKSEDEDDEVDLPEVKIGENVECLEWLSDEKETQPPSRFSEASLVRALENNGVGRPSTFAQTISTLYHREYIDREKRSIVPTDLGMQVGELLVECLDDLFNVNFTASMEESLDEIEKGSLKWTVMLKGFYAQFQGWMEKIKPDSCDPDQLSSMLDVMKQVTDWAPEVKRGKRTYSDENFVQSIREQSEKGEKEVSQRQFHTLLRISCRYKDHVTDIERVIKEIGHGRVLKDPDLQPPRDITVRKLDILKKVPMDESAEKFTASLSSRVEGGRCLTSAQIRALNNILMSHSSHIADFETLKKDFELDQSEVAEDHESKPLIESMSGVKEWKAPVTRGKRVFDDKAFYESLLKHFTAKGFLSIKQRAALKKMVARYKDQITNYEELADQFELGRKSSSKKAKEAKDDASESKD